MNVYHYECLEEKKKMCPLIYPYFHLLCKWVKNPVALRKDVPLEHFFDHSIVVHL